LKLDDAILAHENAARFYRTSAVEYLLDFNSKEHPMHGVMRVLRCTSIVLVLTIQTFALADDRKRTDDDTLNGTWRADVTETQSILLSIKDSRIEMSAVAGENRVPIWVGKLIISEDEPRQHMDWVNLKSGDSRAPDNKCLFRLRGDVLLVIGGGPDQRPTHFYSGPGAEPKTLLFIRIDPENEEAKPDATADGGE
jgi:hypothetical protein